MVMPGLLMCAEVFPRLTAPWGPDESGPLG